MTNDYHTAGRCSHCQRWLETENGHHGRCIVTGCPRAGQWQAIAPGFHAAQEHAQRERVARQLRAEFLAT